jgi:hypothetical protein
MSRHHTVTPVLSAIALTVLWGSASAGDFPSAADLERESTGRLQSRHSLEHATLLCPLCELKIEQDPSASRSTEPLPPRSYALLKPAPNLALVNIGRDSSDFRDFGGLQFRDNQPLVNRLKRVQAWPLFTIWDSRAATLYVGLNRDGEPGVHLRQKRQDRGSLVPSNRVLIASSPLAATLAP